MNVTIYINGEPLQITTSDPDLLARWLIEVFTSVDWQPGTLAEVRVHPTWMRTNGELPARPDWIADSRVISPPAVARSPREFAELLLGQVRKHEQLAGVAAAQAAAEVDPP